ncbi:PAS domain S-box protein [Candidatus Nitronereus thalassa]|nr:PAS domain S-box protein [Candidatus Nitronereus thalassa]
MSPEDIQTLIHELQVHQIELEMQNEELRRTQLELETARDRYSDLYDFAPVGFLTLDSTGTVLEANLTASHLLGTKRSFIIGSRLDRFFSPSDQILFRQHFQRTLATKTKQILELNPIRQDHSALMIRLESLLETDREAIGEPIVQIAVMDLSKRELAEREKLKQTAWFGGVLDTAMDAVITVDEQRRIVLFNKAAEGIFRCASSVVMGKTIDQFIPAPLRKAHQDHIQRFKQAGETTRSMGALGTLFALRADGEEFPIEASISQFETGGKKLMTVILRDITERRLAEEALQESQRRISTLMKNLPGMAYRCGNDRDWTLEFVSEGAFALTGYKPEDLLRNHKISWGRQVIHPDDRDRVWKNTQAALKKKQPYHYTYRINAAEGTLKWVWEQGLPIYSPDGKVVALEGFITDITTQKQSEEALQASQERLDLAVFGARLGIWDWNIQTGEVLFNERWAKMLGFAKHEIEPTVEVWRQMIHPEDRAMVMKLLEAHLDRHTPFYQTEYRLRTKSGKWKWVLDTGKVVDRDSKGAPLRMSGVHQDIHDRKDMEQALMKERNFINAVLETAGALVIVLDRQGRVVRFNRACEQVTGLAHQDVVGRNIGALGIFNSRELPQVKKVFRKLVAGHSPVQGENRWMDKDKTERLIAWSNSVLKNDKGEVEHIIGTGVDITDRKNIERALRESQERFQAFMDHTPTVAFLRDRSGKYVYVNQPFEKIFGRSQAECLGKTDEQLFPHDIAQMFKEIGSHTVMKGGVWESEETTLDSQGKRRHWVLLGFPVHRDQKDLLIGGIGLDITPRIEAEQAVREREQDLRRFQGNLQALGKRLVNAQEEERRRISRELHDDMNQRLAVLALTIQTTQRSMAETDPNFAALARLYDEVSNISDDIRRLAYQLHPSVLDDLGLKIALQSFVQEFIQWAHVPATFRTQDVPESIPQDIAACLYRLTQESLRNVARHAQASQVVIELTGTQDGLRLSIADDGQGFDVEMVRNHKPGLGLVGMRERVSYVNGTLTIDSRKGQGTNISVWVPLTRESS